ncbi:MAG: thiamine pyrophosphate-binding protein [Reinekea sp.]
MSKSQQQPEMLSGGEMLCRALHDEGVEYIYGYPGGSVLHIYDALHQQSQIKHILVRHEQAATHMADAYARATGKAGVVLVTSGPGATNAVTGIATAYMDSIPMVVITGQVMSHLIGGDAFQETDMVGISRPVVKHNMIVKNPKDIPEIIKKAFYIAESGRPGPVVVDIPKDMTAPNEKYPYSYPERIKMRSYNPVKKGHSGQIRKAVNMLLQAKKPIIYSGGGIILGKAAAELTRLAKLLNFPVTNTLMGLGGYPGTDDQFLGMLGMHGSYEANMAMHNADVILVIGARLDDRVTNNTSKFCPDAKLIHIDIDPASISKNVIADLPIVGPVKAVLTEMLDQIEQTSQTRWINSGGLGTMGFGLPAAMGVQLNFPDENVFCVTGEGSIQMNIQELSTCCQHGLAVKILCLNNGYLGMVRQWQDMNYESRYSHSYLDSLPDFVKLAESYGHVGIVVESASELEGKLKEAMAIKDKAVFIDVRIDPEEHVYPMQVPNGAMCDMFLSKTERT